MDAATETGNIVSHSLPRCRGRRRRNWLAIATMLSSLALASTSAADEATPETRSPDESLNGKLVICGGGVLPIQLRNRFIELAGGENAHVVVITTASVFADTDKMEAKLSFWHEQKVASLTILHTRSRRTADEPEFARPLREATGVWFVGGNQNWLTETYLGTGAEREIRGVLARSGVVGGTSAGAAIMSSVMIRRDKPEVETGPGFGFLPGVVVDQHFLKRNRQGRLLKVLGSHPDLVGLGIDEGTALVVEGNRLSVMGDSQVMVCSPASGDTPESVQSLEPGSETDLDQLRTLVAQLVAKPVAAAVAATVTAEEKTSEPESTPPAATPTESRQTASKVAE
jgi:cyanophycinase